MERGIPRYAERKGSLLLRSNNCSFRTGVLNSNWHAMREAEPKNYDIRNPANYNLHKSTYTNGFGGEIRENEEPPISEMKERMADLHKKSDFQKKEIHKLMLDEEAFKKFQWSRVQETGISKHAPYQNVFLLNTTNREDYKAPYQYTPIDIKNVSIKPEMRWRKTHSEFYDRTDHRRFGMNTWQDEYRVEKTPDGPSTVYRGMPMKLGSSLPAISSRYR